MYVAITDPGGGSGFIVEISGCDRLVGEITREDGRADPFDAGVQPFRWSSPFSILFGRIGCAQSIAFGVKSVDKKLENRSDPMDDPMDRLPQCPVHPLASPMVQGRYGSCSGLPHSAWSEPELPGE